ncbi:MAG: hypothetical protein AB2L14_37210 [Candidatus Xenobiia bacterium LiM19]
MSDMDAGKPGVFQRMNSFLRREIEGEPKKEEEGTWSGSTLDYVTKGGITGGFVGAGIGALADKLSDQKDIVVTNKVPVMETKTIGVIPKNHVAVNPDIGDPAYIGADGKPVSGTGVAVEGVVPKRNLLGGFVMEEKTETIARQGNSLISNVLGGIIVGTVSGALFGVALKVLNSIIHPPQNNISWQRSAPPAWNNSSTSQPWSNSAPDWNNSSSPQPWSNSAPGWNNSSSPQPWSRSAPDWNNSSSPQPWSNSAPGWNNSASPQPWSNSAPDWNNSSSPQPWSNSSPGWNNSSSPPDWRNSGSPDSWSKSSPQPWSNTHSKAPYSNTHSQSHSNYSNSHSQSHSNYSNSHSNSWDRHVSY